MNWLCRRGWHKFKPRYHTEPPERPLPKADLWGGGIDKFLDALTKKTYVHDVCIRCGETTGPPVDWMVKIEKEIEVSSSE